MVNPTSALQRAAIHHALALEELGGDPATLTLMRQLSALRLDRRELLHRLAYVAGPATIRTILANAAVFEQMPQTWCPGPGRQA